MGHRNAAKPLVLHSVRSDRIVWRQRLARGVLSLTSVKRSSMRIVHASVWSPAALGFARLSGTSSRSMTFPLVRAFYSMAWESFSSLISLGASPRVRGEWRGDGAFSLALAPGVCIGRRGGRWGGGRRLCVSVSVGTFRVRGPTAALLGPRSSCPGAGGVVVHGRRLVWALRAASPGGFCWRRIGFVGIGGRCSSSPHWDLCTFRGAHCRIDSPLGPCHRHLVVLQTHLYGKLVALCFSAAPRLRHHTRLPAGPAWRRLVGLGFGVDVVLVATRPLHSVLADAVEPILSIVVHAVIKAQQQERENMKLNRDIEAMDQRHREERAKKELAEAASETDARRQPERGTPTVGRRSTGDW